MEEHKIRQEERERIKEKFGELLEAEISARKGGVKHQTKHTVPINRLRKLQEEFFNHVDDPDYELVFH